MKSSRFEKAEGIAWELKQPDVSNGDETGTIAAAPAGALRRIQWPGTGRAETGTAARTACAPRLPALR